MVLIFFSGLSFLVYGLGCFFSVRLKREFVRYGLESYCLWVGALQVSAALGLLAGLNQPWIGRLAAAGLAGMMLGAVGVRIKIRDSFLQTLPALVYFLLNGYLFLRGFSG
ncbi:MAG: DoxX family protein [Verrucomicrobiota bacterium]